MRRITSHISLIAVLAATSLCGAFAICAATALAASTTLNKAALDKSVQEALAKAEGGTSPGTQNAAAAGAETASSGEVFGTPSESSSSLTGGSAAQEEETTAKTATTASGTSLSSISSGVVIPVGIVCILLLGGIAFLILRDARSVAPVGDGLSSRSSAQEHAARRRKRRAKTKAARQQRKRNR
jgi:cobalamin biosynthesis Mg chelatase CobN